MQGLHYRLVDHDQLVRVLLGEMPLDGTEHQIADQYQADADGQRDKDHDPGG